jgi:mannose-6-phosphate isomerase-like protein (cupin superfamily)
MRESEILHGGAVRQKLRYVDGVRGPLAGLSWYAVAPGEVCAAHVHTGKAETWLIVAGRGRAQIGEREFDVAPGDAMVTMPGTPHALRNTGDAPLVFVNIVAIVDAEPVTTTELGF